MIAGGPGACLGQASPGQKSDGGFLGSGARGLCFIGPFLMIDGAGEQSCAQRPCAFAGCCCRTAFRVLCARAPACASSCARRAEEEALVGDAQG